MQMQGLRQVEMGTFQNNAKSNLLSLKIMPFLHEYSITKPATYFFKTLNITFLFKYLYHFLLNEREKKERNKIVGNAMDVM